MNSRTKVVFSKTLQKASWDNTTIVKDDPAAAVEKMKHEAGDTMVIMGSGSIVSQLARAGLIDEYQIMVLPVVLGDGKTMFDGANKMMNMTLKRSRTFKNGKAFLVYEPNGTNERA
jgi:dihydrofolate reductase